MFKQILPVMLVIGVAFWSVWPLIKCGSCVADYGKDGELITWIINTTGKNIYGLPSGSWLHIFDGNIFYPYKNVLAYSDMYFVTSLVVYPMIVLSHRPELANTLAIVLGQVSTMLVIYFWWKKLTKNEWGAMIGTAAFGLSQIRMEYQVHVQMWGLQLLVVGCWLLVDWLEDKKDWKLFTGAGLLGLQVWESLLPVYFAGVIIGVRFVTEFVNNTLSYPPLNLRGGSKKGVILAVIIFAIIAAPPFLAYWGVGREFNYRRDIREAAHNSISINNIGGKFNSPGLYILFAAAIWQIVKSQILNTKSQINSKSQILNIKWLSLILITSLVLALGPVVKWQGKTVKIAGKIPIPLPYAAVYYLIPGFDALRTPSRWMWMAGWAGSGLLAIGLSKSQILNSNNQINSKLKILIPSLILITIVGGTRIVKVRKLPGRADMPEVYKQLEKMPGKVVLEIPMGDENIETERMIYSLYHGKTLVNGFSGFVPPGYWEMAGWVNDGLTSDEISKLKNMGVDIVILWSRGGELVQTKRL